MTFVATANPPTTAAEPMLSNDGWFPDLNPIELRAACKLDGSVTTERFKPALQDAMLNVNTELQAWADEQRSRWGYACLADVPAPQVGGESAKVLYYRRAVMACLQADLLDTYRGMGTLGTGKTIDRDKDDLQLNAADYRRNQRWAISDLLGRARTTIDLL